MATRLGRPQARQPQVHRCEANEGASRTATGAWIRSRGRHAHAHATRDVVAAGVARGWPTFNCWPHRRHPLRRLPAARHRVVRARGVPSRRLLNDNGGGYLSRAFRDACVHLGREPSPDAAVHPTHERQGRSLSRRCYASGPTRSRMRPHGCGGRPSEAGCSTTTASGPRQLALSTARLPTAERRVMNNVFDFNA